MKVKRIVTNISSAQPGAAERFYESVFGLTLLMDQGWVRTYGAPGTAPVQISIASEGGSGTAVPDLSIEVDDIETALEHVQARIRADDRALGRAALLRARSLWQTGQCDAARRIGTLNGRIGPKLG